MYINRKAPFIAGLVCAGRKYKINIIFFEIYLFFLKYTLTLDITAKLMQAGLSGGKIKTFLLPQITINSPTAPVVLLVLYN